MIPVATYNVRWGTGAALANLDADPEAEVVIGGKWFDNDGTLMQDKGWIGCNGEWCITAVADINGDGPRDIVSANTGYDADGTLVSQNAAAPDGVLLGFDTTTVPLRPGQSETLFMEFSPPLGDIGPWDFYVTVDDEAAGLSLSLECGENNNEGSVGAAKCVVVQ